MLAPGMALFREDRKIKFSALKRKRPTRVIQSVDSAQRGKLFK
jgi:hypothetical protein